MLNENVVKKFVSQVSKKFASVCPSWVPPHKTIYSVAKSMKMSATVNGLAEAKYDKCWEKRFYDGTLERDDGKLVIVLESGDDKVKCKMVSNDVRKIRGA